MTTSKNIWIYSKKHTYSQNTQRVPLIIEEWSSLIRERNATLESKFHFQIEDWSLPKVDSFEVPYADCIVTCVSETFTREIQNRWRLLVSVGLTWQGIFLDFQNHFLCIYSTIVLKKYSSQFYNSRLLLHVKKRTCELYFVERTQITSGTTRRQQSATCTWTFGWCQ